MSEEKKVKDSLTKAINDGQRKAKTVTQAQMEAIVSYRKLLSEHLENAQKIFTLGKLLHLENEQFFLDWQDGLNEVSVKQ